MAETITQIIRETEHIPSPPMEVKAELNPRIRSLRQMTVSFVNELDPTERGCAVMNSYDKTRAEPSGGRCCATR